MLVLCHTASPFSLLFSPDTFSSRFYDSFSPLALPYLASFSVTLLWTQFRVSLILHSRRCSRTFSIFYPLPPLHFSSFSHIISLVPYFSLHPLSKLAIFFAPSFFLWLLSLSLSLFLFLFFLARSARFLLPFSISLSPFPARLLVLCFSIFLPPAHPLSALLHFSISNSPYFSLLFPRQHELLFAPLSLYPFPFVHTASPTLLSFYSSPFLITVCCCPIFLSTFSLRALREPLSCLLNRPLYPRDHVPSLIDANHCFHLSHFTSLLPFFTIPLVVILLVSLSTHPRKFLHPILPSPPRASFFDPYPFDLAWSKGQLRGCLRWNVAMSRAEERDRRGEEKIHGDGAAGLARKSRV